MHVDGNGEMRLLVSGGRDYADVGAVFRALDALHAVYGFTELIHGDARGADRIAAGWAKKRGVRPVPYPAAWNDLNAPGARIRRHGSSMHGAQYNAAAGIQRNQKMLDEGRPDVACFFPGGKGTADMYERVQRANKLGEKIEVVDMRR